MARWASATWAQQPQRWPPSSQSGGSDPSTPRQLEPMAPNYSRGLKAPQLWNSPHLAQTTALQTSLHQGLLMPYYPDVQSSSAQSYRSGHMNHQAASKVTGLPGQSQNEPQLIFLVASELAVPCQRKCLMLQQLPNAVCAWDVLGDCSEWPRPATSKWVLTYERAVEKLQLSKGCSLKLFWLPLNSAPMLNRTLY